MHHKIALTIAAFGLTVPVGATIAAGPAFATTRAHSSTVVKVHKEGREGSSKDVSVDKHAHESSSSESEHHGSESEHPSPDSNGVDASRG